MLNENIKKYRLEKGMTQEELADRLHVVRQTVSKWENNRAVPDADTLMCISEILDIPVLKLLGETGVNKEWDKEENIKESQKENTEPDAEELSVKLVELNEKLAHEIHRRKIISMIVMIVVCVIAAASVTVALTYYNPSISYSIIKPVASETGYYYEDIHLSYTTKFGLPLPLKYKELISDFTEKSAAVMKDIRNNYEAPMHIEITVINDKASMRVLYSGTVTKNGVEQEYINSFWVAGNIRESD